MHREERIKTFLSKDSLASHTFVTGSTGAGKTNTVCRILDQALDQRVNFLVIEPAKGEYKDDIDALVQAILYLMDKPAKSPPKAEALLSKDSYWRR